LRVLHVVATGQRRGAEIFTADLVGALAGAGVEQSVAVLRAGDGLAVPYPAPTTSLGADRRVLPGVNLSPAGVGALRRAIHRWDPDIVQAHGGETLKYAVPAARGTRAQIIYRRIGSAPRALARGPRRLLYRRLMGRAARVVAVAEAVRQETLEVFGLPAGRVVTIPNAVDAARLAATRGRDQARRALGLPVDAEVVLSLGALTWEKDPLAHIRVAALVLAERPRAWHLMVGNGPLRGAVEAAVGANGTGARLRLLPARDDVGDVLAASDVVLFASCSEGMPATVIEAGMAGLPVAGYAVAGVSEVVESGTTGLLAPAGDVDRLRSHLAALLADAGLRGTLGAAARKRCLAHFDIAAVAPRYLDLYAAVAVPS
jgi:glycosyltransferase involved in cell wall biosynthesis